MIKHGIDQDALITRFSQATARQGEALRKSVQESTLKGLQGRELTLANIRRVLGTVAQAASTGAAASPLGKADVEGLLAKAFAGMDSALEQAVQAHRRALQQMVDQGLSLRETQLKKALADIEKMEDTLFAAVRKVATQSDTAMRGAWGAVLEASPVKATGTGIQAGAALQQLTEGAQQGLREGRALSLRASQALLEGYAALASGVLIGMSGALRQSDLQASAPAARRRKS